MGNIWRCCICAPRQSAQIHPINSRSLTLDVEDTGAVSMCFNRFSLKKRPSKLREEPTECLPHCAVQEHDFNKLILEGESPFTAPKCDKETEVENKDSELGREDSMTEWLAAIVMQNALLPIYVTFNNKRHLSMRSKFTKMIQKMNYSNSFPESKEDDFRMVHVHPQNILSGISNCPHELDLQLFQFSVRQTKTIPVLAARGVCNNSSVVGSYNHVNRTPVSLLPSLHALSGSTVCEGELSSKGRSTIRSEFPGRPFQISSNWLDEDFEENILKDPKPPVENEQPKATEEPPLHGPRASQEPELPLEDTSSVPSVKDSRGHDPESEMSMESTVGLFLSTISATDTTHESSSSTHRFANMFNKRKNRIKSCTVYSADVEDTFWR